MAKQIVLHAFDMASAMHNSHGLWKHPDNQRHRVYKRLNYWIDFAKTLEKGLFDAIFLADVLGVYDVYQQNKKASIQDGVQIPLIDPAFVVPAMASVTKHLSFVVTASTTYEHPFSHARRFSTLDHLTDGRIGWNVVTSYLPNAASNFGLDKMITHDKRYDMADEFLHVTHKLWEESWEDGSVVEDTEKGILINSQKVKEVNHKGVFYQVEGPHLCEPSIQRTPVIYQAGSSPKGREFAAKHAECIFVGAPSINKLKETIQDIKERAKKYHRKIEDLKFITFLNVVVEETDEKAEKTFQEISSLWSEEAAKAQYGGSSGYDLSQYTDLDEFFEYKHTEHGQARAASLTKNIPKKLTVREVLETFKSPNKSNVLVGSPDKVADAIQFHFEESGIDGYNLAHFITPGSIEKFVRYVVPELQKRGIYKTEYKEGTLRKKLFNQQTPPFSNLQSR